MEDCSSYEVAGLEASFEILGHGAREKRGALRDFVVGERFASTDIASGESDDYSTFVCSACISWRDQESEQTTWRAW